MLKQLKKLPVGIENFREIRQDNFYYVDKTKLIEQLLTQWGKVNLFTRPRRFGKSLNMSMLKAFFEAGTELELFDGLYISGNRELCENYMGRFPVISISLKGINAEDFDGAYRLLVRMVNAETRRLWQLLKKRELDDIDKRMFDELLSGEMSQDTLVYSLRSFQNCWKSIMERK